MLGYRPPSHTTLPLLPALALINAALTVERLVKEGRQAELLQFLHDHNRETSQ